MNLAFFRRVGEAQRNPPSSDLENTVGFATLHPPYIAQYTQKGYTQMILENLCLTCG